jgi:hypothetical protein
MFTPDVLARMPERVKGSFVDVDVFCAQVLAALERGAYEVTVPAYVRIAYAMRLLFRASSVDRPPACVCRPFRT